MKTWRAAVFGCGMISEFHLKGWRRCPDVQVVALGDASLDCAKRRRAEFCPEALCFDNLETMLAAAAPDFVDILTPPQFHREHCLQAAQAGVHIICQKPLCYDLREAWSLVNELESYPRQFVVHENHRYRPWFQAVLRHHRQGLFGTPQFLGLEQNDPFEPAEFFKLHSPLGIYLEYGTHLVDMIRALLGEPRRVYARFHYPNRKVAGESLAHAVYEFDSTTAAVNIAWKANGVSQGSFLLEGDAGEAHYEGRMTRGDAARFRLVQGKTVLLDEQRNSTEDYEDSFYFFERHFVDGLAAGRYGVPSVAENFNTLLATLAAYEAVKRQAPIDIRTFAEASGCCKTA
ncbi:MAG: Gfo/Idh/MocA family oxidoreductase [Acidobacteriota bacterium]